MTTVDHFVNDCPNFSKFPHLRLFLRTFSGMYLYFGCGGCSSMQQSELSLPFVFVCLLCDLLSFFSHCLTFHLELTLFGMKDFLFVLLGFPRHASLRDRSPESSEQYVTLDSRISLIRTTFAVRTSFITGSHLRVSRVLPGF